MELPDKQAKWIYARFYLGMTVKEIAQAEGVDLSWVYKSIRRGLKHLAKNWKKFFLKRANDAIFVSVIRRTTFAFIGILTTE